MQFTMICCLIYITAIVHFSCAIWTTQLLNLLNICACIVDPILYVRTVMSLLEAPCAKTLSRALLFRVVLCVVGALIMCYSPIIVETTLATSWATQAVCITNKPCCRDCHCNIEQHILYCRLWTRYKTPTGAILLCVCVWGREGGATILWKFAYPFWGASIR